MISRHRQLKSGKMHQQPNKYMGRQASSETTHDARVTDTRTMQVYTSYTASTAYTRIHGTLDCATEQQKWTANFRQYNEHIHPN